AQGSFTTRAHSGSRSERSSSSAMRIPPRAASATQPGRPASMSTTRCVVSIGQRVRVHLSEARQSERWPTSTTDGYPIRQSAKLQSDGAVRLLRRYARIHACYAQTRLPEHLNGRHGHGVVQIEAPLDPI